MEERGSPRLVTQRQLEIESPRASVAPARALPPSETPTPATPPAASGPSNRGLLERQLRWYRERAKFESNRTHDEPEK